MKTLHTCWTVDILQIFIKLTFNEISKEFSYGTGSAATKYDGENKYLRITDIDDETRMFKPKPLTSPNCIIEDKYKLKEDDIVFARTGASVGKSYLYNNCDGNLIYAGFLIKMSVNSADSSFIFYETLREKYYKWVSVYSVRSGQPGLNAEELKSYKLYLPNLIEQKKIGLFLSAVDEKLQQLSKKKELLEDYKKGIMQKIFSQEIRFKDDNGNSYPEWEEMMLGKVGKLINGLTYSPKDISDDGVLVLRSSNIQNNQLSFEDNVYVNIDSFNAVQENDILICVRNGSKRLIGKNCLIDKDNEGVAFGAFMTIYRSAYNKFIFHLFSHSTYYKYIHKNLGATINSINNNDLKKFKILFPCELEQEKIADFLKSIDCKIKSVSTQIEKTKEFKKGLIQQMFV